MKKHWILLLFIPLLIHCQHIENIEISQWRGPNRDGFYPGKNLLKEWPKKGPELIWESNQLGKGYSTVAITSDKIFTAGTFDSTSHIIALDHNGNILWKKPFGKTWTQNFPGTRSTPLIYGEKGYILSGLAKLVCFNSQDGEIIWAKDLYKDFDGREVKFGITENLLIDGDKLFCTPGGTDANVIALNKDTGNLIWKSKGVGEKNAYCSPIIIEAEGKKMFITITEKSIIALDPENGKLFWSHDLKYPHGIHANTPIYHDGYIFAMNGWEHGSVMLKLIDDGNDVEEVWRSNLFDLEHGDVMLVGNNIYGTDYTTKHFSCVDWKTGIVKDSIKEFAPATLIAAEGLLYSYTYEGEVVLIKPTNEGFEIISSFKLKDKKRDHLAHPVINDGKLYIRHMNTLWVYNISKS